MSIEASIFTIKTADRVREIHESLIARIDHCPAGLDIPRLPREPWRLANLNAIRVELNDGEVIWSQGDQSWWEGGVPAPAPVPLPVVVKPSCGSCRWWRLYREDDGRGRCMRVLKNVPFWVRAHEGWPWEFQGDDCECHEGRVEKAEVLNV